LENSNQYAYNKRCALIIELINRYQELYPEKIELNVRRMQFYTNRYSIIMNTLENENTTQEVLWVMNIVENF
jgi:hypothetical protein